MGYNFSQVQKVLPKWYAQNWRSKSGLPTPHQCAEFMPEAMAWYKGTVQAPAGTPDAPVLQELVR